MKISKLFHWLYATLMFLPIMFFLPSCIYYGFNEHAVNTETTDVTYVYESNEVTNASDLVIGNIYNFNCEDLLTSDLFTQEDGYLTFKVITPLSIEPHDFTFDNSLYLDTLSSNLFINFEFDGDLFIYFDETSLNNGDYFVQINYYGEFYNNCIIQYIGSDLLITDYLTYTDYNEIDEVVVNDSNTIPQQLNRAWTSIWNLPFFAWTHNSFISAPFTYISGLFGLAASNPINYLITWFASISIIWLCFDVVMYVPNLAHRWLDRGALQ